MNEVVVGHKANPKLLSYVFAFVIIKGIGFSHL